jgi:hypothetical protein
MIKYPKIKTIYNRNQDDLKHVILGAWSLAEFDYLKDNTWVWTEKVDGTNIRVIWDGEKVTFGGRTDNAQIPAFLLSRLQELFTAEKLRDAFNPLDCPVILFGEGYGKKIQKVGGRYKSDGTDFILFDVKVGDYWLERDNVADIANSLNIKAVPILGTGSLLEATEFLKGNEKSRISEDGELPIEGLILRPVLNLYDHHHGRIIGKLKCRDLPGGTDD